MQSLIIPLLLLVIIVAIFGYMAYRSSAEKRARERRRNQFHDRV
jgi:preprotein translocase subunit YajC